MVDKKIKNDEAYEESKLRAKLIVESYGGEYLARGGNTTVPENELWTSTRLVVIRLPSRQNAETTMCIIDGM